MFFAKKTTTKTQKTRSDKLVKVAPLITKTINLNLLPIIFVCSMFSA